MHAVEQLKLNDRQVTSLQRFKPLPQAHAIQRQTSFPAQRDRVRRLHFTSDALDAAIIRRPKAMVDRALTTLIDDCCLVLSFVDPWGNSDHVQSKPDWIAIGLKL